MLAQLRTVAAICAGIFGTVLIAYALRGQDVSHTHPGALTHSFVLIAVAQFVGACGEEFGWRYFLTPYLRTRYGVLTTGTIVGVLWGLWHVQVFAVGRPGAGPGRGRDGGGGDPGPAVAARELLADQAGAIGYLLKDRVSDAGQFVDGCTRRSTVSSTDPMASSTGR